MYQEQQVSESNLFTLIGKQQVHLEQLRERLQNSLQIIEQLREENRRLKEKLTGHTEEEN
jgi:cell division septum initiation protein DivIVA